MRSLRAEYAPLGERAAPGRDPDDSCCEQPFPLLTRVAMQNQGSGKRRIQFRIDRRPSGNNRKLQSQILAHDRGEDRYRQWLITGGGTIKLPSRLSFADFVELQSLGPIQNEPVSINAQNAPEVLSPWLGASSGSPLKHDSPRLCRLVESKYPHEL
jgi:hypothetical protein